MSPVSGTLSHMGDWFLMALSSLSSLSSFVSETFEDCRDNNPTAMSQSSLVRIRIGTEGDLTTMRFKREGHDFLYILRLIRLNGCIETSTNEAGTDLYLCCQNISMFPKICQSKTIYKVIRTDMPHIFQDIIIYVH